MPWKLGARRSAACGAGIRLSLLRSTVERTVLRKIGGRSTVTTACHRQAAPTRIPFHAENADSLASVDAAGSFFLISLLGRQEPGLRRKPCRNAVAMAWMLEPGVLSVKDHTHSGLVFVVNPGSGTAPQLFVPRRLGLDRRNRPAQQISPTCGLPREANFSGLPVLHCVTAPLLRYGMRRAQTLTRRITPRPRWARPG
jgi:hypothetical protein